MPRSTVITLLFAGAVGTSCGLDMPTGSASTPSPFESAAASRAVASAIGRTPLPSGFPILPGASPVALADDDLGLIAAWSSDRLGSAAYDFYIDALPRAGYEIVGTYPGGDVALIRFQVSGGIWQVVSLPRDGRQRIEVRLDRP